MVSISGPQELIFDADDTLWENNIYFEDAFDHFCQFLNHSTMNPTQVRSVMDEIELVNARIHGYGSKNFANNLAECFQRLAQRDISAADLQHVREFAYAILKQPMELIEGVADTVAKLSEKHRLSIFTKGDRDEQQLKVDRSGIGSHFAYIGIVKEKNRAAYEELASTRGFQPQKTWMIGNSPKSDINPALAAGLNAVFVPHPRTWSLEHEEVPANHARLLTVARISELVDLFG